MQKIQKYSLNRSKKEKILGEWNMMEQKEHKIQIVVLSLLDIAGIMISFLSANYIRNRRFWYENIDIELSTAILYMILLYLLLAFLKNSKQDFFKRGPWEELVEVTAKVTQYTALLIASMFCFKIASEISRIAFFLFYFFAITLVFVFRSIYKGFLLHVAKKSINTKRLVILTMAENVEEIKKTSWHGRDVELSFKRFDPAGCAGHSSWNRMLWHSDSGKL